MRVRRRAAVITLAAAAVAGVGAGGLAHEIRPSGAAIGAPSASSSATDAPTGSPAPSTSETSRSAGASTHRSRLLVESNLLASSDVPGLVIKKNAVGEGEPQFQPPCLRRSVASTGATAVISAEYTEDDTITEIVGEFDNTPQATHGYDAVTSWVERCRNDENKQVAATASGSVPGLSGSNLSGSNQAGSNQASSNQGTWWRFPKDSNGWVDTVVVVRSGDRVAYLGLVDKVVTRAQAEALGAAMVRRLDD